MRSGIALLVLASCAWSQTLSVYGGREAASNIVIVVKPSQAVTTEALIAHYRADDKRHQLDVQRSKSGALTFVVPSVKASEIITYQLREALPELLKDRPEFRFRELKGEHCDLLFGDRPVVRYVNKPRDGSSPTSHELTFKPFHHIFDPTDGKTLLTNGPGLAADKSQRYPHHRGLFYGFNKISYAGKTCDVWHGRKGEYVIHDRVIDEEAGPVFGRQKSHLSWCGQDGQPFAEEEREVTVYRVPGGTMIDVDSRLTTRLEKVRLEGDPQHAGFQFRAANSVHLHGSQDTYYLRPDGQGRMGETRNWDPKTQQGPINQPWNACSFTLDGLRYTVLRVVHPENPKDWRGSERDYGRFGDDFVWDLTPQTPLRVRYRFWVQAGEMTVEQAAALARGYTVQHSVDVR